MMKNVRKACLIVSVLACLNYGMIAIFKLDLLKRAFPNEPSLRAILYCFIAICGMIDLLYLGEEKD